MVRVEIQAAPEVDVRSFIFRDVKVKKMVVGVAVTKF
jgi:hypothetical protein